MKREIQLNKCWESIWFQNCILLPSFSNNECYERETDTIWNRNLNKYFDLHDKSFTIYNSKNLKIAYSVSCIEQVITKLFINNVKSFNSMQMCEKDHLWKYFILNYNNLNVYRDLLIKDECNAQTKHFH